MRRLPSNLDELARMGGPEALARKAGERAEREEREWWLHALEEQRDKLPDDLDLIAVMELDGWISALRLKLGLPPQAEQEISKASVPAGSGGSAISPLPLEKSLAEGETLRDGAAEPTEQRLHAATA